VLFSQQQQHHHQNNSNSNNKGPFIGTWKKITDHANKSDHKSGAKN